MLLELDPDVVTDDDLQNEASGQQVGAPSE